MPYPTRSPGPYSLEEEEIPVPTSVETLGADIYRKAYQRGWQEFGYGLNDDAAKLREELKQAQAKEEKTKKKGKVSPAEMQAATETTKEVEERLARLLRLQRQIANGVVPQDELKGSVPSYHELCERVEALYKSGYVDGWEANALAYIRVDRRKKEEKKKQGTK